MRYVLIFLSLVICTSAASVFGQSTGDYSGQAIELLNKYNGKVKEIVRAAIQSAQVAKSPGGTTITQKEFDNISRFASDMNELYGTASPPVKQPDVNKKSASDLESSGDYVSNISRIWNNSKRNNDSDRAKSCKSFAEYLLTLADKRDYLVPKSGKPYQSVTSMKPINFSAMDVTTIRRVNDLFQTCVLSVNRQFTGFCPDCKGIQKFTKIIHVKQKLGKDRFLAHEYYVDSTLGLIPGGDPFVIYSDNGLPEGKTTYVGIRRDEEKYEMANGFEKELSTFEDLGPERASAVLCHLNQWSIGLRQSKFGPHTCGMYNESDDFYGSPVVQPVCQPNAQLQGNKIKGSSLFLHPFDFKGCGK